MKLLLSLAYYYWYAIFGKNIKTPIWTSRDGDEEAFIFNNKEAADQKVMVATLDGHDTEYTNGGRLHTVVVKPGLKPPPWKPRMRRYPH